MNLDEMMAGFTPMFLSTFGDATQRAYTPAGGVAKNISIVVLRERRTETFNTGSATIDFDVMEIEISSRNNTEGQVSVQVWGRGGLSSGDTVSIDEQTWYVRSILAKANAGMHRLLIATSPVAFIE